MKILTDITKVNTSYFYVFQLAKERGKLPPASEKHGLWGDALRQHTYPWVRAR